MGRISRTGVVGLVAAHLTIIPKVVYEKPVTPLANTTRQRQCRLLVLIGHPHGLDVMSAWGERTLSRLGRRSASDPGCVGAERCLLSGQSGHALPTRGDGLRRY